MSSFKKLPLILGTLIVLIASLMAFKSLGISFTQVGSELKKFNIVLVFFALAATGLQIGFQASRFWILFPKKIKMPWKLAAWAWSYGQWINQFIPARLGDVIKIMVCKDHKGPDGQEGGVALTTGVLFADKILDTACLFVLAASLFTFFSFPLETPKLFKEAQNILLLIVALILIIILFFLYAKRSSPKITLWLEKFAQGFGELKHPLRLGGALFFGLSCWLMEGVTIFFLCKAAGHSLAFSQCIFVLLVLNLGIAVPVSFANIGTFEASLSFALHQMGINWEIGLAIATAHHGLQILGVVLWTLIFWLRGFHFRLGAKLN